MSNFIKEVMKNDAFTENMGIAQSSTGDELADQFSKSASHRGRDISVVHFEQGVLDRKFGKWALRFVMYLRLITRVVKFFDGLKTGTVQKGQGNRDESFKRFLWYAVHKPNLFYANLPLFLTCGCEKDMFELMWTAKQHKIKLDENRVITTVLTIERENDGLLLKYLPLEKSSFKTKTPRSQYRNYIAKKIRTALKLNPRQMRMLKGTGLAHLWQKLISWNAFDKINFNHIPGKALFNLAKSKFFENNGLLARYNEWLEGQPVVKFTGYVHELGAKVAYNMKSHLRRTIDKQFLGLLKTAGPLASNRRVICAVDRSGSMDQEVAGQNLMNIAESLGLYFSNLLQGAFNKYVIVFSQRSRWIHLNGEFCDQKLAMSWGDCPSNTDFQSVIDSFVDVRKRNPGIPEEEFPNTLLVVSDMQFDRVPEKAKETAYQIAVTKLKQAFSKEFAEDFIFIWWDCTGRVKNFPTTIDEPGAYVISGWDGAILDLLLGAVEKKASVEQSIQDILSQEVLEMVVYE